MSATRVFASETATMGVEERKTELRFVKSAGGDGGRELISLPYFDWFDCLTGNKMSKLPICRADFRGSQAAD